MDSTIIAVGLRSEYINLCVSCAIFYIIVLMWMEFFHSWYPFICMEVTLSSTHPTLNKHTGR